MKFLLGLLTCLFSLVCLGASVDTITVYSDAMQKGLKCVVIKPDTYKKKKNSFPVVYLLHGYDGWYSNWIIRVPDLKKHADRFQLLIVCPDGGKSSWYFDSPLDSTMRYETYVSKEVPAYIDEHYRTIKNRKGRAITGLSMGGHGAMFIAFRHADTFGACASMSGLMDLNATRNKYELEKRIGDTLRYAENWKDYSVISLTNNYPKDSLAILFDCGISDAFIKGNRDLHQKLLQLKIPHDYIERPGKHEWAYWRNSVQYHLMFFRSYFDRNASIGNGQ